MFNYSTDLRLDTLLYSLLDMCANYRSYYTKSNMGFLYYHYHRVLRLSYYSIIRLLLLDRICISLHFQL